MVQQSFYSHGKLLISAEYLVLDNTTALAIPTKKGQWLHIEEGVTKQPNATIYWKSLDIHHTTWFETELTLTPKGLQSNNKQPNGIETTLINILHCATSLNPNFLSEKKEYHITTQLEFDRKWGLGSSSTLINNIAQWAKVDGFTLLEQSFGGSGYDIACAQHPYPITYERNAGNPIVQKVDFDPNFKNNLFFIYLNQKQDSKEAIKHYRSLPQHDLDRAKREIQKITASLIKCTSLKVFEDLIDQHEHIISELIKTPTVKSRLFSDYPKSIKSLGGWGGDFILVTGDQKDISYFKKKGFTTIIPYDEMLFS